MRTSTLREPRSLPNFAQRLESRREDIARSLWPDPNNEADGREIDAALEDLAYWLNRSWLFLRHADRNASIAVQRKVLADLAANPVTDIRGLDDLDPAVLIRIGSHLTDDGPQRGPFRVMIGAVTVQEIREAILSALNSLGTARRGRPPGTDSLALRQLAYGLAAVWASYSGSAPARRVAFDDHNEYGPFRTFVASVLDALPRRIRMTRKGGVRGVDFIVRLGVQGFRAAQTGPASMRPFGPLEDSRW